MSRPLVILLASAAVLAGCSPSTPETEPAASAAVPPPVLASAPGSDSTTLVVYKEATCPCCNAWVDYMRNNGFRVVTYNVSDLDAVKQKHNIADNLQSCHTTEVGGYYVEGHVPVDLVRKLLAERPPIAGIAVPGMPVGSPGMEVGGMKDPYDVVAWTKAGGTSVFAKH